MGRAAAIAYAREGADVAIPNYLPEEEPDARKVVDLIDRPDVKLSLFQAISGRKALAGALSIVP